MQPAEAKKVLFDDERIKKLWFIKDNLHIHYWKLQHIILNIWIYLNHSCVSLTIYKHGANFVYKQSN